MSKIFLHYKTDSPDARGKRHIEVRDFLRDYFAVPENPQANYFIIDPFLEPLEHLYVPMREGRIEDSFYCDLISTLAMEHFNRAVFSIITKKDVVELSKTLSIKRENVPSVEFQHNELDWCLIRVCQYTSQENTSPYKLHDRWFLQENGGAVRGIHIGPSLQNFYGKDITITDFDSASCRDALMRFKEIWSICEAKRE